VFYRFLYTKGFQIQGKRASRWLRRKREENFARREKGKGKGKEGKDNVRTAFSLRPQLSQLLSIRSADEREKTRGKLLKKKKKKGRKEKGDFSKAFGNLQSRPGGALLYLKGYPMEERGERYRGKKGGKGGREVVDKTKLIGFSADRSRGK